MLIRPDSDRSRGSPTQAAELAAARRVSELVASLGHDLRTPLTAMMGFHYLALRALEDVAPEKPLRNLRRADAAAHKLLALINAVVDVAKIETGRLRIRLTQVDPGQLVRDCLDTLNASPSEGVELRTELPAGLPPVRSDPIRLKQVLHVLLSNALQATSAGHVVLRACRRGAWLEVEVEDTGCGIPPEELPHLLAPVSQLDRARRERARGAGLGLPIARSICDLLDVELRVRSTIGAGTTFSLALPLADAAPRS